MPGRVVIPTAIPTLILPVIPSVAPGYRAPNVEPSPAHIIGVTQQPFVGISLQDAIAMSLLKNPNLAVSASNVKVARYQIVEAKGAFDVQLHLQPSSSFSVSPPQNFLEAGPGQQGDYSPAPPTSGPGNIIQHQSTFQYGVGGQTVNGGTLHRRHPAAAHLQQHGLQRIQPVLSRDAEPPSHPAAAQEPRHERQQAAAQAGDAECRRNRVANAGRCVEYYIAASRTRTGISFRRGATSPSKKRR